MLPALTAAALLGLASIPHCTAMCGPLAVYANSGPRGAWGYHLGRAVAYLLLGSVAGVFGATLSEALPTRVAGALFSWTLAASLAWTAYRLWQRNGAGGGEAPLVALGRNKRTPGLAERAFQVLPRHPVTIGLLTGILPCGALYSALLVAASADGVVGGAAAMGVFGATSAVGLIVMGGVASQIRKRIHAGRDSRVLGRVLAAGLLVGALVLAVRPISTLQEPEAPPVCHTPS
ncbi:MAG: sulfite exporter TauE/SafE family protein [Sandaracinaceae bacterium]